MPVTPTYPGVYIEEVPSSVRTIMSVATSITALIGRTKRGPVNDPKTINSYGDFERKFGGLWKESSLGFAVRDFYRNGGGLAIIVRLHKGADEATLDLKAGGETLSLIAANPGSWGDKLRARVDHDVSSDIATGFGLTTGDLFNLYVRDGVTGDVEEFRNLTVSASPRRVDKVLENNSTLVVVDGALPAAIPDPSSTPAIGEKSWDDNIPVTNIKVQLADQGSDGSALDNNSFTGIGFEADKKGLYALENVDLFNLLCIPPYLSNGDVDTSLMGTAGSYCEKRRAMLILDPPTSWTTKDIAKSGIAAGVGTTSKNAAIYFPRLRQPNPLRDNQVEVFAPCGVVAGVMARTDTERGIWKAPAGLDATLVGVPELNVPLTDLENGELNPLGINCLRTLPAAGRVVWGARTLQGDDRLASQWKYVPVRRLALMIEESLYRGTKWVVFEPNDAPLWAQIRLNVGTFMHNLFRQGAFQGKSPKEAYFVKCDKETTPQADIDRGIVNIHVGFAPLKPAEFVIIKISQIAGQNQA